MKVLVLGGTREALVLTRRLTGWPEVEPVYSLAGRTRQPALPGCPVRHGGFGGADGLARYLRDGEFAVLVDATHPYAARMAANARRAAAVTGVPLLKFLRPPWEEPADAPWLHAATPEDAAHIVSGRFHRVFLSSGLGDAAAFASVADCWFLIRTVDPPAVPPPLAACHCIVGRGPFEVEGESALLARHRIDAVVSKNSGGDSTSAKLHAARDMSIPVVMIDRPAYPEGNGYDAIETLEQQILKLAG